MTITETLLVLTGITIVVVSIYAVQHTLHVRRRKRTIAEFADKLCPACGLRFGGTVVAAVTTSSWRWHLAPGFTVDQLDLPHKILGVTCPHCAAKFDYRVDGRVFERPKLPVPFPQGTPAAVAGRWVAAGVPNKLDVHLDPLVGKYVRTGTGTWWADMCVAGLSHIVRLTAPGDQPSSDQMVRFEKLVSRLAALKDASQLETAPKDDGWGHAPPTFNLHTAPVSSITMNDDGSYFLILEVDPDGDYMLAPTFEISPDYILVSAEWSA